MAPRAPDAGATARQRILGAAAFVYGIVGYAAFLGTFLYAIGFVGNWFVPKSIDSGTAGDMLMSLVIDAALLCIFVVQHTIMARPGFKRAWTRIVPASIERSTFVFAASAALMAIFLLWRPVPTTLWHVQATLPAAVLAGLSLAGWLFVPFSSLFIDHFDLFGVRQVWLRLRSRAYEPVGFRLRGPYRFIRHPLMVGFLVAFWATPHMTVGHLFFSIMTSSYILMGIWFEERDLLAAHGEDYVAYRRRIPALVPRLRQPEPRP